MIQDKDMWFSGFGKGHQGAARGNQKNVEKLPFLSFLVKCELFVRIL